MILNIVNHLKKYLCEGISLFFSVSHSVVNLIMLII